MEGSPAEDSLVASGAPAIGPDTSAVAPGNGGSGVGGGGSDLAPDSTVEVAAEGGQAAEPMVSQQQQQAEGEEEEEARGTKRQRTATPADSASDGAGAVPRAAPHPPLVAFQAGGNPSPSPDRSLLGAELVGRVDRVFDAGYFVTVQLGGQEFRGACARG